MLPSKRPLILFVNVAVHPQPRRTVYNVVFQLVGDMYRATCPRPPPIFMSLDSGVVVRVSRFQGFMCKTHIMWARAVFIALFLLAFAPMVYVIG